MTIHRLTNKNIHPGDQVEYYQMLIGGELAKFAPIRKATVIMVLDGEQQRMMGDLIVERDGKREGISLRALC